MRAESSLSTLERLRLEAGLTRPAVGEGAGLDRKTVYSMELGIPSTPQYRTIQALARFYGVSPEWLWRQYYKDRQRTQAQAA